MKAKDGEGSLIGRHFLTRAVFLASNQQGARQNRD